MSLAGANAAWQKSSFCDNATCLEVASDRDVVAVRNNTRPSAQLTFDRSSWQELVTSVREGQLTR
jgi:hypothetical protein